MRLRRASRGALVATRFTRNETPALCPRWLVGYDRVDGLGSSLAIGRTAAALPLGNRLLRRKIFLGFLKIPKVFYALFSGYYGKLSLTILSFPPSLPPGKLRHFFLLFPLTCPLE